MTWVVWRQHRTESIVSVGLLAIVALILLITGLQMAHTYQQSGLSACVAHGTEHSALCRALSSAFGNQYGRFVQFFAIALLFLLPVLLGGLVGAPLVARELEQRTHLLTWMQSITRVRWLAVTVGVVLGAGLLATAVLMGLLIWWYSPVAQIAGRFIMVAYDFSGPVLLATTVLALALGVAAGALTRRTVPAILLTLGLLLAIRLPVEFALRPNFAPQTVVTWPLGHDQPPVKVSVQDWQIGQGWLDAHGNRTNSIYCYGPAQAPLQQTPLQCMQQDHYRGQYLAYQPADRFWTFQWMETGLYLGISALAVALTFWLVRRRVT
jgi:hypothetical protein